MEAEYHTWQVIIPREALQHDFLLHGLFAMASLELAAVEDLPNSDDYVSAALDYHANALGSFRVELANLIPKNQQAVLAFSMFTYVLSLALPHFTKARGDTGRMVQNMVAHFELSRGAGILARQNWDELREAPILRTIKTLNELPSEPIEPTIESALARLNAVNDEKHNPAFDQSRDAKLQTITYHAACQRAIVHLEELFSKCEQPAHRGYALAWLNLTGRDYVEALESADPVALLVLMHWGVLGDRCGDGLWWARSIGSSLVDEVTEALVAETNPVLRDSVSWAREQVGL